MKIPHQFFAAALLVTLCAMSSLSQQKDKKATIVTPVETRVNLMVLDPNNQLVEDVTSENIKIFEDDVEQKVTHFAKRAPGVNLVLVVDNTGSMRTQMERVEQSAGLLALNLDRQDEASIIRFVDSDKIEIVEEWTDNRTKLLDAIRNRLYVEGGASAVIDALYLATGSLRERNKKDPSERSAIVLISDCEDRDSFYDRKQLFAYLKGTGIQVFSVALTGAIPKQGEYLLKQSNMKEKAESLSRELAARTGGTSTILEKVTDESLQNAIKSIMIELRSQYSIGYKPINQQRDTTRKIRVEVADGPNVSKRRVFVRESYYVAKDLN
ncbi:MAG TPA: VWA domain-containing protein [Pyrinomonadaceae bacterium]|nr:VWA domain-containing protein [Pyrinomonadaceae bacterium]